VPHEKGILWEEVDRGCFVGASNRTVRSKAVKDKKRLERGGNIASAAAKEFLSTRAHRQNNKGQKPVFFVLEKERHDALKEGEKEAARNERANARLETAEFINRP